MSTENKTFSLLGRICWNFGLFQQAIRPDSENPLATDCVSEATDMRRLRDQKRLGEIQLLLNAALEEGVSYITTKNDLSREVIRLLGKKGYRFTMHNEYRDIRIHW